MSEQIEIDAVKFKIGYDDKAVEKGLKDTEDKAKDAGGKAGKGFGNEFDKSLKKSRDEVKKLQEQLELKSSPEKIRKLKEEIENFGKETKKSTASLGDLFNAIAGAAVVSGVKSFFSSAAAQYNKLESAMMRVESIAKGFGRSVAESKKQVQELADKGFLNLNQAASSFASAISLGFDEKQSRKFIDSLSDIAAYQNTIGDGAAAVESGLAGLLSNSAEKVENIGVPVKLLNMQYQENIKTMGAAAARLKFYNGIVKESEKFQGDAARSVDTLAGAQNKYTAAVDKTMVAVGKGLEPALKSLYGIGTQIFNWLANFINGLDSSTKTFAAVTIAITALTYAIGAAIPVFQLLAAASPLGWVTLAIAAIGALIAVLNELAGNESPEKIVKRNKESAEALKDLGAKADTLSKINKRTIEEQKELTETTDKLKKKSLELGVSYDEIAKKAKNASDATQMLINIERERDAAVLRRLMAENRSTRASLDQNIPGTDAGQSATIRFIRSIAPNGLSDERYKMLLDKRNVDLQNSFVQLYQGDQTSKAPGAAASAPGKSPEFRFIKARDELRELSKEHILYLAKVRDDEEKTAEANKKFQLENVRLAGELRGSFAQYIEDEHMAKLEALKVEKGAAIANRMELFNLEKQQIQQSKKNDADKYVAEYKAKKKLQDDLSKIDQANLRKETTARAESLAQTMQAAQASASGFAQVLKSRDIGSALSGAGGLTTGISKIAPGLSALGPLGASIGAVGGIVSTISGLFGKSDAERAQEAEQQKRRDDEAKAILELQAGYQKSLLALQEAQAKLPFENLTRNLRLADISAQQRRLAGVPESEVESQRLAERGQLLQGTLSGESGSIGKGALFSGVGSTPDELIQFLGERAAQNSAVGIAGGIADALKNISGMGLEGAVSYIGVLRRQLSGISSNIPGALFQAIDSSLLETMNAIQGQIDYFKSKSIGFGGMTIGGVDPSSMAQSQSLISEISADTGIAENLLSVIEQSLQTQNEIAGNTKKTADNTSKALELRPDRERSFIDVGKGYIQSLGQRITSGSALNIAQGLSDSNFQLPAELGRASAVSSAARTLQERMLDMAELQVRQGAISNDLLRDIRAAVVELLVASDGNPATVSGFTLNDLASLQQDAARRRV